MAYDKVVDSAKLDLAMKATADGIRETTNYEGEIPWDSDNGFYYPIIGLVSNAVDNARSDGYADGYSSGQEAGYSQGYLEGEAVGIENGKKAERDFFWDNYGSENKDSWIMAFAGNGWNDLVYNPTAPMVTSPYNNSCNQMFQYSAITDTKVDIKVRGGLHINVFAGSQLVTIRSLEVTADVKFNGWFGSCSKLVHLNMKGTIGQSGFDVHWSTLLDKESHISIINVLSTTTSGLTITLSKSAVNKAFETTEGANDGSTSEEWLALVGTRSNWTISLA